MKHHGLFITFEGPEGSGKTTLVNLLKDSLEELISNQQLDYSGVFKTREPGGLSNPLAEKIRDLVLNNDHLEIPKITEAFLFAASRSAHVELSIKPALANNQIVLCDRYLDSSIVYQGYGNNIDTKIIDEINYYAVNNVLPDITFFLSIDPKEGLKRISVNKRNTNRFDNKELEYHKRIFDAYNSYFSNKSNVYKIDASQSPKDVLEKCLDIILNISKK